MFEMHERSPPILQARDLGSCFENVRYMRRYPDEAFAVLREGMLGRGPVAACTAVPACGTCWPAFESVTPALQRLPDASLFEWLLLYSAQGADIAPLLRRLRRCRITALYTFAEETYQSLLGMAAYPSAPPFPHAPPRERHQASPAAPASAATAAVASTAAVAGRGADELTASVSGGVVPSAWLSNRIASGPLMQLRTMPAFRSVCPETPAQLRTRLESASERRLLEVDLSLAGALLCMHTAYVSVRRRQLDMAVM
jgi:hypothetical protein